MKKQAFNPYLPSYEYVPDGEPYVFDGRLYVFGSHDRFNGKDFCLNDYVCWSAPTGDLGDWRYEGFIYYATQDPLNKNGKQHINAPDVQIGLDGKYYLYYVLHQENVVSVAVCDKPAGTYQFYGHVKFADGHAWGAKPGEVMAFDPGVLLDDDGRIYLYSGFAPSGGFKKLLQLMKRNVDGAFCVELEPDMLTIKGEPVMVAPGPDLAKGTGFESHAFFEASSPRKINGKYYFVYSSELSHELCYAVSDKPHGGFQFGGTLVSNGDIGYMGNTEPLNYTGNTHGGMAEINGQWYIFYHRQTNKHNYSRQGCAERLVIRQDGSIPQVEMTSCGLNGGALAGMGTYEARIACNLSGMDGACASDKAKKTHPYFTQSGEDREGDAAQYIANMRDGAWAGFKYFQFADQRGICLRTRGNAEGTLEVRTSRNGKPTANVRINPSVDWAESNASFNPPDGIHPLYFMFKGKGAADFQSFTIE
jgi:hypothetical protein